MPERKGGELAGLGEGEGVGLGGSVLPACSLRQAPRASSAGPESSSESSVSPQSPLCPQSQGNSQRAARVGSARGWDRVRAGLRVHYAASSCSVARLFILYSSFIFSLFLPKVYSQSEL